ncbi:hypothetical protein [Vibrio sp. WXL210]|uniref:hypothetical protein n=1 Tax=Vibrio sp. WXL210 TaxID=3450709 RepID=UPI003EC92B59
MLSRVLYFIAHICVMTIGFANLAVFCREYLPRLGEFHKLGFAVLYLLLPIVVFHIGLILFDQQAYMQRQHWRQFNIKELLTSKVSLSIFLFAFVLHGAFSELNAPSSLFDYQAYLSFDVTEYKSGILLRARTANIVFMTLLVSATAVMSIWLCYLSINRRCTWGGLCVDINRNLQQLSFGSQVLLIFFLMLFVIDILVMSMMGIEAPINISQLLVSQFMVAYMLAIIILPSLSYERTPLS